MPPPPLAMEPTSYLPDFYIFPFTLPEMENSGDLET